MRTAKEVQNFLDSVKIKADNIDSVIQWLWTSDEYKEFPFTFNIEENGLSLPDIIDFVNSPSPTKEKDLNPLVAQFEKIEKEMMKMRKLINGLK